MSRDRLRVLQVSTTAVGGGAERVALSLHEEYRRRGIDAWLAVGGGAGAPGTLAIQNDARRGAWARGLVRGATALRPDPRSLGPRRQLARALRLAAEPGRYLRVFLGNEDFDFPGTAALLRDLAPDADVLHLHNLHGSYFDLRELPRLTAAVPAVLTLHDAWLLTGHCAHPFDCPRWRTGCGECPYPDVYVPIRRDASAENWLAKRAILAHSRLRLATPSRWLMRMVEESGVLGADGTARVVPNGIDTTAFRPTDRRTARAEAGLAQDAEVIVFAATALEHNPFKDFATLLAALPAVAERRPGVQLVALGVAGATPAVPGVQVTGIPFDPDPAHVARHLAAADVYVHPARAENFPLAILEAMACEVPVVASSVGGIPEMVEDGVSGTLVPMDDAPALAAAVVSLLEDGARRARLASAGLERVRREFTLTRQADAYLSWYEELLDADR